jgi:Spy/CpxP family protein refolding chaperone
VRFPAALALVLAAFSMPATAQPGRGGPLARVEQGPDEFPKMVDAYLLSHVQDALGLTEAQSEKVLPLILKLQADRRARNRREMQAVQETRKLLGSGTATESQVAERMKEFHAIENEEPALLRKDLEAVDKELTLVQQAKYRVLEQEVVRSLRARVRELRGEGPERPLRGPRDRDKPKRKEDEPLSPSNR